MLFDFWLESFLMNEELIHYNNQEELREIAVNIHSLIITSLALIGCKNTEADNIIPTGGGCGFNEYPFSIDEPISAYKIQQWLNSDAIQTLDDITCEMLCEQYVYITSLETCSFNYDIENLSAAIESLPTDTEVGTIQCSGTTQDICDGRRPLGYIDQNKHITTLGGFFAQTAQLEAASIISFVELAQLLTRWNAPKELIHRCLQAADDEYRHTRMFLALAQQFNEEPPPIVREKTSQDLFHVALNNAVEGCVFETWSALKAHHQAMRCKNPTLKKIYAMVAADETRHGQLAWDMHSWFMTQLSSKNQERIAIAHREALEYLQNMAKTDRMQPMLASIHRDDAVIMAKYFSESLGA